MADLMADLNGSVETLLINDARSITSVVCFAHVSALLSLCAVQTRVEILWRERPWFNTWVLGCSNSLASPSNRFHSPLLRVAGRFNIDLGRGQVGVPCNVLNVPQRAPVRRYRPGKLCDGRASPRVTAIASPAHAGRV